MSLLCSGVCLTATNPSQGSESTKFERIEKPWIVPQNTSVSTVNRAPKFRNSPWLIAQNTTTPLPAVSEPLPTPPANSNPAVSSDLPVQADTPSHPEDPLIKLWELPIPEPVSVTPETPTVIDNPAQAASSSRALATTPLVPVNDFRRDPIARTALSNARSNAASFTDGVGGIGSLVDSAFLPARMNNAGTGFVLGPATIYPSVNLGLNYQKSSNVSSEDGLRPTTGVSFNFTMGHPELRRTLGASYTGLYIFGQEDSGTRPFTQQLALRGSYGFAKLELGLGITFTGLSGENRDIGGQSNQDLFTIAFTSTYEFTPKTSVDLDLSIPVRQYSAGANSAEITATSFLNYQYSPKTTIGVGVAAGLTKVQEQNGASNQDAQRYVQVLARASTATSEILSFSATLGAALLEAGDSQKVTPVFGLGATWTPRLGTSFSLTADQRPQNSAANTSTNFVTTSVALTVTQRLGRWMRLSVSGGYENASYYSIGGSSSALNTSAGDRHDQLYVGQMGLNADLGRRWSAQLLYSYTKNTSNTGDAFDSSRAQFQINFNF